MNPETEFTSPRVAFLRATTVLISGAGSDMGLHTAQTLLRTGYAVYAGIRDPQGRNQGRAAYEAGQFGIETTILMPGVFTSGTDHFQAAEFAKDEATVQAYASRQADFDHGDASLQRLFRPGQEAPVQGMADEIARVLALPAGQCRTTVDYSYGAEAVNAVAEAQTSRLFTLIGYDHLLNTRPTVTAD